MTPQLKAIICDLGLLLILAALALPLFRVEFILTRWIYCSGAAVSIIGRLLQQSCWHDCSLRQKRLHRLELWSAIFFCVGAVLMWLRSAGEYDWVAFTLAGAVIVIYASIMLPRTK